jgi:hypothetical protein
MYAVGFGKQKSAKPRSPLEHWKTRRKKPWKMGALQVTTTYPFFYLHRVTWVLRIHSVTGLE